MLRAGRVVALLQRFSKSLEEVTLAVQVHESAFFFFYDSEKFHGAGTELEGSFRSPVVVVSPLYCNSVTQPAWKYYLRHTLTAQYIITANTTFSSFDNDNIEAGTLQTEVWQKLLESIWGSIKALTSNQLMAVQLTLVNQSAI